MQDLAYEDQFNKIFSYIRLSGVLLTRNSTLTTLKLIEEQLASESTDVLARVMTDVQERLTFSASTLPLVCPRINRSSIGYRDE